MTEAWGSRRRLVGLVAGLFVFAAVLAWPLPELSAAAHTLAAVFGWAVVYWVSEVLPPAVTLLASALAIVLGVAPAPAVLAPYADPVAFLFPRQLPPGRRDPQQRAGSATGRLGVARGLDLAHARAHHGRAGIVTCALSLSSPASCSRRPRRTPPRRAW